MVGRRRWWLALGLATTGIAALVMVLVVWPDTPEGAATPEDAIAAYVDALNRHDGAGLRRLSATGGATLDAGIQRRLAEFGSRGIQLSGQDVQLGPAPHQASARLTGSMAAGEMYEKRLFLNRHDDRWYVNLHDLGPATGVPLLPTAAVSTS